MTPLYNHYNITRSLAYTTEQHTRMGKVKVLSKLSQQLSSSICCLIKWHWDYLAESSSFYHSTSTLSKLILWNQNCRSYWAENLVDPKSSDLLNSFYSVFFSQKLAKVKLLNFMIALGTASCQMSPRKNNSTRKHILCLKFKSIWTEGRSFKL